MNADHDDLVAPLLHVHAAACEQIEPHAWKVEIANGSAVHGTARVVDEWLVLESTPNDVAGRDPWELLGWNAALPGAVKFALRRGDATPHVRAELPLAADIDVGLRLRQSFEGLSVASALLTGKPHDLSPAVDGDGIDLPGVCAEAGWPFVARPSGALAVTLETGTGFHQAILTTDGSALRISASLTTDDASRPAVCRAAVAALALRASAAVRMVRAAVADRDLRLEVVLADAPAPAEVRHALAALSVACRMTARETAVLADDETVAGLYLTLQPKPSRELENGGSENG